MTICMNPENPWILRDLAHIWHPATQMKDFEQYPPCLVHRAQGSFLYTNKGPVIDGISSWWCKSLGHGHPAVLEAISSQLTRFDHVIGTMTTHPSIVELAEQLTAITNKQHVFFASDGSSAVEIAMKLALQGMQLRGFPERNQFIALENAYHGETLATLNISDIGKYKTPFQNIHLPCHFIKNLPYISGKEDPTWLSCDNIWPSIEQQLDPLAEKTCALIVEPLVQGAAGMRCYSADFLKKLADWAKNKGIYFIADEIMTGMGRTGKWLSCQQANVEADLICLSKGLTSGALPLSCVMIDTSIYELFYDDFDKGKTFFHSHTFGGNALAVSAALATIQTIQRENILEKANLLGKHMLEKFQEVANKTQVLQNIRSLGALVAGDLLEHPDPRLGFQMSQKALELGALLRPIGKTLYWLPPLNTEEATIDQLAEITERVIHACY
jgi:adenosylmethionine---8-amino-7-oxononanoate aminotransferase